MRNSLRVLALGLYLMGFAAVTNAGPITNGSFEDFGGQSLSNGSWGLFESVPGWTSPKGVIEIGTGGTYGVTGFDGKYVLELDSTGNSIVAQVVGLTPGAYTLSFLAAQRSGVSPSSGSFDVLWKGLVVGSYAPTSTAMALYTVNVIATGSDDTVAFEGTGTSDSYGAIIDKVSIPDGGLTSLLLGLSIAGLGYYRRMSK